MKKTCWSLQRLLWVSRLTTLFPPLRFRFHFSEYYQTWCTTSNVHVSIPKEFLFSHLPSLRVFSGSRCPNPFHILRFSNRCKRKGLYRQDLVYSLLSFFGFPSAVQSFSVFWKFWVKMARGKLARNSFSPLPTNCAVGSKCRLSPDY